MEDQSSPFNAPVIESITPPTRDEPVQPQTVYQPPAAPPPNYVNIDRYTINIHKTMHSALEGYPPEVLNEILRDGQLFAPENFEDNFQKWPAVIRDMWTWIPVTMDIDDVQEVVGYTLRYKNPPPPQEDEDEDDEEHNEDESDLIVPPPVVMPSTPTPIDIVETQLQPVETQPVQTHSSPDEEGVAKLADNLSKASILDYVKLTFFRES